MRPTMSRGAPRTSLLRAGWVGDTHPLGSPCPVPRLDDAGQAVRQPEPLLDERHEVMTISLPADNQRELLHQHRIDVVEVEPGAGRHLHEGTLRRTGGGLTPEIVEQLGAPVEEVAGAQGSAVKDRQSPDLRPSLEGVQTGSGTDRSPSGTVRRRARSPCWLRVRGERRAFWH
jgi:hypothetical protein